MVVRKIDRASRAALAAAGAAALAAGVPASASAQQVLLQNDLARVALEPYTPAAGLGSRAEVAANWGVLEASVTAAVERGGANLGLSDEASRPAAWTGDSLNLGANWTLASNTHVTVEAGDRDHRTLTARDWLNPGAADQESREGARFLRLTGAVEGGAVDLKLGAETSVTAFDTVSLADDAASVATRLSTQSRRVFADVAWRLAPGVALEASQSAQDLAVTWRGAGEAASRSAYLSPSVALVITPAAGAEWRLAAEQTLAPVDPWQYAAYAQAAGGQATSGGQAEGSALQPERGWRYLLGARQPIGHGVTLGAEASDWRLQRVTELGPVRLGEAPVSLADAERRQLKIDVAAPLAHVGLPATLSGQVTWLWSKVADPFTGQKRQISGDTPYRAQVRLSGALPAPDLAWSLTAQAEGPQSVYQMSQVTMLAANTGLDGALTYGAGPLKLSLEIDNALGGERAVTTLNYAGVRTDGALASTSRRKDDTRTVRISLRRGL